MWVNFLTGNNPFHQCGVDNNEESKSVCKHTVLLPVTPNRDISGTSQKDSHTHIQKHTVPMKNRRMVSKHTDTVLQKDMNE